MTDVTGGYARLSMHGVRIVLLKWQAEAKSMLAGICRTINESYVTSSQNCLSAYNAQGVSLMASGDLFLVDLPVSSNVQRTLFGKTGSPSGKLSLPDYMLPFLCPHGLSVLRAAERHQGCGGGG